MTFEDALLARIGAIDGLDMLDGRIAWGLRIDALPAVTLQMIADSRPQHMKGFQRIRPTSVQVDVWSRSDVEARAIREILIAGLVPPALVGAVRFQRVMITAVRSMAEPQAGTPQQVARLEVQRQSIDFIFTHNA